MSPISDDAAYSQIMGAVTALGQEVGALKTACVDRCGKIEAIAQAVTKMEKRMNGNGTMAEAEKTKWVAVRDIGVWAFRVLAIVALAHYGLTKFIGPLVGG